MIDRRVAVQTVLLVGAAFIMALASAASQAQSVLRLISQSDLTVLDPVFSTANITSNHGYMVYDQLFGLDSKRIPKPQMVDTYQQSPDGLTWKFKLRSGLKFSDGQPVEAKDVVASVKRWAGRHAAGRTVMTRVKELVATGPDTFEFRFSAPFAPLLVALAEPETPLFIMREKEANTDVNTQIAEVVGSGPFLFVKEEWVPGAKAVYRKNPSYVPRSDPPDGFAGAKIAKVDRVEWLYLPDPNTATQALIRGEGDVMEIPPTDLIPILQKDSNVVLQVIDKTGTQAIIRPNHLFPRSTTRRPARRCSTSSATRRTRSP